MGMSKLFLGGFCLVTDRGISGLTPEDMALAALKAGVKWIQYRDKGRSRRELYREALKLRAITRDFGAAFIVNDHADIALAVDAEGVHLGQDDLPLKEARKLVGKKIIGISAHSLSEAGEAFSGGADYIGFGPVFYTATKDAGMPRGLEMLKDIKRKTGIPAVAIGGISEENLPAVFEAGADAVAMVSAVLKGDISGNAERILHLVNAGKGEQL